jgi:hypothetical protein
VYTRKLLIVSFLYFLYENCACRLLIRRQHGRYKMKEDKKTKSLISLDDLTPREDVNGGAHKGKRTFGSFDDLKKKKKPKDRF